MSDLKTRPPVVRMKRISFLLRKKRVFNVAKLATEFECSTKTIYRDIAFMRDQLGFVIKPEFGRSTRNTYIGGPTERIL